MKRNRWRYYLSAVVLAIALPVTAWAVGAQHTEHAATESGARSGDSGPGPINWTDFGNSEQPPFAAYLINFALLCGIYWHFGKKPASEGLKRRRASIVKEIEEAQRFRREAEERAKMYQSKLETLTEELKSTRQSLVDAGKGERERIIREAQEKAERMQTDAQALIEQEIKQACQDLARETSDRAIAAAQELLRRKVTPADHERLADEHLAELTRQAAKVAGARTSVAAPIAGPSGQS